MTLCLWLNPDQLQLWQHGRLLDTFTENDEDRARFSHRLEMLRPPAWRLILDLPGEEFTDFALPRARRLTGLDRRALIRQALASQFPETQLRGAMPLGTDAPWRLCGIDEAMATPWLRLLEAHAYGARGIHSLSPLAAPCLPATPRPQLLQIFCGRYLRQIVLSHGQPCFSRQLRLDAAPQALQEESTRLLNHARFHDWQPGEEPGWLVLPPSLADTLPEQLSRHTGIPWRLLTGSFADWQQTLLARLRRADRRTLCDLRPVGFRRQRRHHQGERLLTLASVLLLGAAFVHHQQGMTSIEQEQAESRHLTMQAQAWQQGVPADPPLPDASRERLQAILAQHAHSREHARPLQALSQHLPPCQQALTISALHWETSRLRVDLQPREGITAAEVARARGDCLRPEQSAPAGLVLTLADPSRWGGEPEHALGRQP